MIENDRDKKVRPSKKTTHEIVCAVGAKRSVSQSAPLYPTYPWAAALIGTATVSALLPARANWEGPILVIEDAEYDVIRCCTEIPPDAVGLMLFSAGPVILKEAIWVRLTPAEPIVIQNDGLLAQQHDEKIAYVIKSPLVYERFLVVGSRFSFKVKTGQLGWKLTPGPIHDDATASYLNLFLA